MATANSNKSAKPRGKPFPKGVSGNPKGRPKDGESWSAIIKAVGEMYPEDLLAFIGQDNELGKAIAKYPKQVQLKYLVTARIFAAMMFDPNPKLWTELLNRAEGKVPDKIKIDNLPILVFKNGNDG